MNIIFGITLSMILFIPALILTCLIWIFGGWTKGWDDMPNPLWQLFDLTIK